MNIISKILDDILYERSIWDKYLIGNLIELPEECPYKKINLTEYNSLSNPYVCRCSKNSCHKIIYLKDYTLFNLFPRTNLSTFLYIIKYGYLTIRRGKTYII